MSDDFVGLALKGLKNKKIGKDKKLLMEGIVHLIVIMMNNFLKKIWENVSTRTIEHKMG